MIAFINLVMLDVVFWLGVVVAERGVARGFAPGVRDLGTGEETGSFYHLNMDRICKKTQFVRDLGTYD